MNLRKTTWLVATPVVLVIAGAGTWSWLLHSEAGARWLFARLDASMQATIEATSIEGDLGSGLRLGGFHFDDGSTRADVEQLNIAIDIDLLPPAIDLEALRADTVAVRTLRPSDRETDWESAVPGLSLPMPLRFRDIQISGLQYMNPAGETVLLIPSANAAGSLYEDLALEHLTVSLPDNDIALSGQLGLTAPHAINLEFSASGDVPLLGSMKGDLETVGIELKSQNPQVQISGTLGRLLQTPEWDLEISSPLIRWPLDDQEPGTRLTAVEARSTGEWPQFELDLEGDLELQGLESSRLRLAGDGSSNAFEVRSVSLAGPELSLNATGSISWENGLQLALNAALERLDPGEWLDDWPDGHPVNGEIAIEWGGEDLTVSSFRLGVARSAASAEGQGVIDIDSGVVEALLSWSELSWPPGSPDPIVNSKSGNFQIAGQPENWNLDGSLQIKAGEFPEGQLRMSGMGNLESLNVTVHEGTILGGTLSGSADWNWTESQPFNAQLAMEEINITPLVPQYPGVLNARLTASGELAPFHLGVELQHLKGTIRDQPISANGGFHLDQGKVFADALNLQSGASTLFLNGSLYQPDGIDFSASVDSLALFSSQAAGQIAAEGNFSLHSESPKFSATLSGQQLAFGDVQIAQIETRGRSGTGNEAGPEVIITGLQIGQRPVESLSIQFGGDQPLQRLSINALAESTGISLNLDGAVNDWNDPLASGWSGSLSDFRFDHEEKIVLSLEQAVALEWNPTHFSMEEACLSGTRQTRLCLASSWLSPDELNISANIAAIPVGLTELLFDTEFEFTQLLSGTLNWSQSAAGGQRGGARIDISAGAIQADAGDEVLLETGPGLFGFELADGQLRQGDLDFSIPDSGTINFDFNIPDLSKGRESPIRGTARIDLNDIGTFGLVFPVFDAIDGVLSVDLSLAGTLSDPAFKGSAGLSHGRLENLASGFSFSEINISGAVTELDRSELNGSFRAGDGVGKINAAIQFENILAPVIDLTLEGESLTIIDVPDLKVIANPDISLSWRNKVLEVDGRLLVPTARISPSYLPQNSISQSEDVVIVAGELPKTKQDAARDSAISIRGNLELELGEEIVVDLDLARARVTGQARFNWQDKLIPIADGAFDATGEIQAFGQFLRVTRGRISFPGIPADNPHLNIRAEREIFGNSQIRRAGLMVAGTLRRPLIEAYTVPMTNKHRAQTLLVTGSDFNYEQGVGVVDVGMYILPRLYISYGIGIFEDGNVLKARYDLGRGFGIRATSGQRETGLDISYTLER
jgi:translocation and assembly module TamB